MDTFKDFLEAMIRDGVLTRITDSGVLRIIDIYTKHDLQPPADLMVEARARGLITIH